MHDAWVDKLSEYLDDALPADERAKVAAHLAGCPACTRALDELKQVVQAAHALTPRPPAHDLWSGIAGRLASEPAGRADRGAASFRKRTSNRISFTLPQLAAASLLLAAVSGGLAWTLRDAARARVQQPAATADTANAGGADARLSTGGSGPMRPPTVAVSFADAQYDAAVADLEKALSNGRSRLDPSTVAIVEQNLQIIDHAIAQARQALEADPANSYLSSHLVETRRKKLDLLRHAAALAN
jgi:hypothetical protein